MKKRACFFLVVFMLTGVLYAAALREGPPKDGELVLLHTNDFHGAILSDNGQGGLAGMADFVRMVRASNPQVLLVDAGDINSGGELSSMFDGEVNILAYNIMGYDAVTFGDSEFDGTQERLERQISLAEFPFVSSNIQTADGSFLGGNQYIVKHYDNFTVGIFGITTLLTRTISSPDSSLVFLNEIDAARAVVDILRNTEKVDIVIGLTHMGDVKESADHITSIELAKALEGIDIIVDGHSHTLFSSPRMAGDAWVISADELGRYIGFAKLTVRDGVLVDFFWTPIQIGIDPETAAMLEEYQYP